MVGDQDDDGNLILFWLEWVTAIVVITVAGFAWGYYPMLAAIGSVAVYYFWRAVWAHSRKEDSE